MLKGFYSCCILAALLTLLPGLAEAGKIVLDADVIERDEKSGIVKASGGVVISEADYRITGSQAVFNSRGKDRNVVVTGRPTAEGRGISLAGDRLEYGLDSRLFLARGKVLVRKEDARATCDQASYSETSGEIVLKGSASVEQKGSSLRADSVVISGDRMRAEGRARLEIPMEDLQKDA